MSNRLSTTPTTSKSEVITAERFLEIARDQLLIRCYVRRLSAIPNTRPDSISYTINLFALDSGLPPSEAKLIFVHYQAVEPSRGDEFLAQILKYDVSAIPSIIDGWVPKLEDPPSPHFERFLAPKPFIGFSIDKMGNEEEISSQEIHFLQHFARLHTIVTSGVLRRDVATVAGPHADLVRVVDFSLAQIATDQDKAVEGEELRQKRVLLFGRRLAAFLAQQNRILEANLGLSIRTP